MAGLFDWMTDGAVTSPIFGGGGGGMPPVQQTGSDAAALRPPDMSGNMGRPVPPPAPTQPMPPVQQTGADMPYPAGTDPMTAGGPTPNGPGLPYPPGSDPMTAGGPTPNGPGLPYPQGTDPMTAGGPTPNGPGLPVPTPQPRPPGATPPPGPPISLAPPGNGTNGVGPGLGVGAPTTQPGQGFIARALGITDQQSQQMGSGLSAGLKSVGENWNKPGLAAFAGSAGSAMEGSQKRGDTQQKQAADYLNAAIKSKQAGDEAGYKQNYLRYLAAKLQADTDKAASKDAGANKNDTPTQLYLASQRLVQPDRNAATKLLEQMRKDGADPAEIAKKQTELEAGINAKLNDHYATLGIHPQTAAQLGQQPGNAQENPIDAGKLGITKDNIGQKLQPGQYFKNPADGKVYQYKGPKSGGEKKGGIPDKPTSPEPVNPSKPWQGSAGPSGGAADSSDDED